MARSGFSKAYGGPQDGANGLSRPRVLRAKVKPFCSFAIGTEMAFHLRNFRRHRKRANEQAADMFDNELNDAHGIFPSIKL